jgi:internalin A
MKFTYKDLQQMRREAPIKKGILTFNRSTQDIQFLTLTDKEELKEVRFESPQPRLRYLDFGRCEIERIVFSNDCDKLQAVYLQRNQLTHFEIKVNLPALELLDLSFNENLTELKIGTDLPKLSYLYLHQCNLKDLSALSGYFTKEGFDFNIEENKKLQAPPPEIVEQGKDAVVNYFIEREKEGVDFLYEAKLLIIGEGRVGKTSLQKKLLNTEAPLPHEKDTTHGIDISITKDIFRTKDNHQFVTHIWDFGGQAVYHATHQFFLTKRSLYIIVDDASRDDVDLDYWLQVVERLTDKSPIILLQNQKSGRIKDIGIRDLKSRYDNIKEFHGIDLSLNNQKEHSKFERLIDDLQHQLVHLPLVGIDLPKPWVKVREEISRLLKEESLSFISKDHYEKICTRFKITEHGRIERMSRALHDLGVFLYFIDNPVLCNTIIIENEWATKAVYDLLQDRAITERNGHFSIADVHRIWVGNKFQSKHNELLELMKMFELIYELPDQPSAEYIAAQLLPKSRPDYSWDYTNNLRLVYEFPFLPKGLISRLIVRLNRFIFDVKKHAWRTGVVLQRSKTRAEIREIYGEKRVEIRLNGEECKEFLVIINDEIDQLCKTYNNLPYEKKIPCICSTCRERDKNLGVAKEDLEREKMEQPFFYTQSNLMRRLKEKEYRVQCEISFEYLKVQDLLDNIYRTHELSKYDKHDEKRKLKVFISYSKDNHGQIETFVKYIKPLEKSGKIEIFYDLKSIEGEKIHQRILKEIKNSDIILFFLSPESLATDYIADIEIPEALKRYEMEHDKVILFPVVLEDCLWPEFFGDYNVYNKATPIIDSSNQKQEWIKLSKRFSKVVNNFSTYSSIIIKEESNS